MHFIGIDIGTSSVCGVAFNFEESKIETISKENDSNINVFNDWEKNQDPLRIYQIVLGILNEFIHKFTDIKGIGITGQMHGVLYLDKHGNSISPLITWQDGRGNLIFSENLSYSNYLVQKTGYSVASGFGLVSHFYNLKNNLVPQGAYKICTIMDFIAMQLTGVKIPTTDFSNAASLGFFDLENLQFNTEALKSVSINPQILPEVTSSGKYTGLYKKDIPVYTAIGDNQASFLGSLREIKKSALVNVGTSGQISVYSENFVKADTIETRPFPGGGYLLVGASLCGGTSFNILKNLFEKTIELFYKKSPSEIDFFKIANLIDFETTDRNNILQIETLFNGTRINPDKRGSIRNISMENLTPQNLIFGFYTGVCNELHDFFRIMPDKIKSGTSFFVGSGNAIRKNQLLRKVFENKFGCSLFIPEYKEEAAFGASLCAAVGGKYIDSFLDAGKSIRYIKYDNNPALPTDQ